MGSSKKDNGRAVPEGRTQVNFNISIVTLEKVKDLAYLHNVPVVEIYIKSTARFLEDYEQKNGDIKPRPSGKEFDTI